MQVYNNPSQDIGWDSLDLGVHVCSIYRNKQEQFAPLVPFYHEGLRKNQKAIYINNLDPVEYIWDGFNNNDLLGHLEIVPQSETYTKGGLFEGDRMILLLKDTINSTLGNGYGGIRAAAEMNWATTTNTPLDSLVGYELKLNEFYPQLKLTGVCQYNEANYSPEFLIQIIRTHPYLVIYGNLYENKYFYTPPGYGDDLKSEFKAKDYSTIISAILDDAPLRASGSDPLTN